MQQAQQIDIDQDHAASMMAVRGRRTIGALLVCGVVLIVVILISTVIAVLGFRDRAMDNGERWLKNTALLLSRHIDQQLDELARIQKDVIESLQAPGISSRQHYERRMSDQDVHLTPHESPHFQMIP
jgi:hypothetical protein